MKLLTTNNAKKGLLLTLKLFGFLFTAFFAFLDIVFGDPDEYDDDMETTSGTSHNLDFYKSTAAGKPPSLENVNNIWNDDVV